MLRKLWCRNRHHMHIRASLGGVSCRLCGQSYTGLRDAGLLPEDELSTSWLAHFEARWRDENWPAPERRRVVRMEKAR